MADLRWVARVRYVKTLPRPIEYYATNCLLPGATSDIPFFVTTLELARLKPSSANAGGSLGTVAGLTSVTSFSATFPDFETQWKRGAGESMFYLFQGGPVWLEATVIVRVDEMYRSRADIVDVIMEHELLHVKDIIDVMGDFLPQELPSDDLIKKYLVERKPVDQVMLQNWFRSAKFTEYVKSIFAEEHNRRGATRDSGAPYKSYQDRIDHLWYHPASMTAGH